MPQVLTLWDHHVHTRAHDVHTHALRRCDRHHRVLSFHTLQLHLHLGRGGSPLHSLMWTFFQSHVKSCKERSKPLQTTFCTPTQHSSSPTAPQTPATPQHWVPVPPCSPHHLIMVKSRALESGGSIGIPALPSVGCVILGKLHILTFPWFPHL